MRADYKHKTLENVRYNDLDTFGHVNSARYLSYLEEARIDYFEKVVGFDKRTLNFGSLVARVVVDYFLPIEYGDEIELYTRCLRIGTKSFDFETLFVTRAAHGSEFRKAALGVVTLVGFDAKRKTTVVLPDDLVATIEAFEGQKLKP